MSSSGHGVATINQIPTLREGDLYTLTTQLSFDSLYLG